ncbi:iron ABC transporter permease [Bacillus aquiflavi]|uniref:Iron ABC transporter permease n=1 Tax=Bacillus aquiflavi TaxID=2672567 RepID=A0A6B3W0N0_9BACI|nr:iron ABC transporter permease [Bacillus aquiflavi]MBA4538698.1 iron ABC transporter permease [Bacillus aquiflavi]NEY83058.1 iron ABC transporter permease [Bacillus aquiflavi]
MNRQEQSDFKARNRAFRAFFQNFIKSQNGSQPDYILLLLSLMIAFVMFIPILYVIWSSLFAGTEQWIKLLDTRIPGLLWNTLSLTFTVTILSVSIGISLAWFVNRCDLPGRKVWQWLLALPLVIPPYVGAMTYIIIFGPTGWLKEKWMNWFSEYPINIYSFWGVVFVLTMFTYPYVFLIASSALRKMNQSFEDAARIQGLNTFQVFWKVNLPFLRPAIGAGAILISLYVLSDFGAIAMLRYTTFTAAIYYQMGNYDHVSASILSMVLILITLVFLAVERRTRLKQRYYQTSNTYKKPSLLSLGKWKAPVLIYVLGIFSLAVLLPTIVLIYWSSVGVMEGALDSRFWGYAWNSVLVAGVSALICMIIALPIVYLKLRYPSVLTNIIDKITYSGYALPGVIVALGVVFVFNQYIPWLYNTIALLFFAYIVRFLPQAMQSGEAALSLVSPRIDEAARSLGYSPVKVMLKVIVPLIIPGILAGGALVFVSSIKELPATLLLRPPGFDTLAVRVWTEASEAVYHLAAPAALLIIIVSMLPLRFMLKK